MFWWVSFYRCFDQYSPATIDDDVGARDGERGEIVLESSSIVSVPFEKPSVERKWLYSQCFWAHKEQHFFPFAHWFDSSFYSIFLLESCCFLSLPCFHFGKRKGRSPFWPLWMRVKWDVHSSKAEQEKQSKGGKNTKSSSKPPTSTRSMRKRKEGKKREAKELDFLN